MVATRQPSSLKGLLKQKLRLGIGPNFYGPRNGPPSQAPHSIKDYKFCPPATEKKQVWYITWNNQTVKLVGRYNHFIGSDQSVCIYHPSLGYLAIPESWLFLIKNCICDGNTLWQKGCQCGGI